MLVAGHREIKLELNWKPLSPIAYLLPAGRCWKLPEEKS